MLTPAQLLTLKAAIAADAALNAQPQTSEGASAIAVELNKLATPDFLVWRTDAPVSDIFDAIDWTKYTPSDVADGTALFTNRLLAIQTKQMNLQNMLIGKDAINAAKANIRAGLRDAVIALPSGTGGAAVSAGGAGGATALTACTRKATRGEKELSTGTATTGPTTAALMGFEGVVSYQDVLAARAA